MAVLEGRTHVSPRRYGAAEVAAQWWVEPELRAEREQA